MSSFFTQPLFGIALTLFAFQLGVFLKKKFKLVIFNPVLVSVVFIIGFLSILKIDFEAYNVGGKYLSFLLGPTVVALGVLFYEKYQEIKSNFMPFLVAVITGGLLSIVSVCIIVFFMGVPDVILRSLAPKSVTAPIAIEISNILNGMPSVTAGVVIAVGVFGNAFGPSILKILGISSKTALGTALGTASHGIGTARALEEGKLPGAYSGLAMCINGLITALVTPFVVEWLLLFLVK